MRGSSIGVTAWFPRSPPDPGEAGSEGVPGESSESIGAPLAGEFLAGRLEFVPPEQGHGEAESEAGGGRKARGLVFFRLRPEAFRDDGRSEAKGP